MLALDLSTPLWGRMLRECRSGLGEGVWDCVQQMRCCFVYSPNWSLLRPNAKLDWQDNNNNNLLSVF